MALWEGLREGLWKTSENLWKPLKISKNLWKALKSSETIPLRGPLRDPLRGRFPSQNLSGLLPRIVLPLKTLPKETPDLILHSLATLLSKVNVVIDQQNDFNERLTLLETRSRSRSASATSMPSEIFDLSDSDDNVESDTTEEWHDAIDDTESSFAHLLQRKRTKLSPRHTRICRASYLCLENWNGEEKPKKSPKFVRDFLQFPKFFSEILFLANPKTSSSESVRAENHTAENKGLYFLEFIRIRPIWGKIEKNDYWNFFFSSHFTEIHFSWISTEWDVLWCIGGPQPKGIPAKRVGKNTLKVKRKGKIKLRCFQGVFRRCHRISGCFRGVFTVFSRCFQGVFRRCHRISGCFRGVFTVFSGYFQALSPNFRVFSGCFQGVFRVFSGCFQGVFRVFFPIPFVAGIPFGTLPTYENHSLNQKRLNFMQPNAYVGQCARWAHCKRWGSEKSAFSGDFWEALIFSGAPVL